MLARSCPYRDSWWIWIQSCRISGGVPGKVLESGVTVAAFAILGELELQLLQPLHELKGQRPT
jgi:hypothetical protein